MKKINLIEIFLAQRGLCFYCFEPLEWSTGNYKISYTKDHFYPKSKGFKQRENIVLAHEYCNGQKGNRKPTEDERVRFEELYRKIKERRKELKKMNKRRKVTIIKKGEWKDGTNRV